MKKISDFIIKFRYVFLGVFIALIGLSIFLIPRVDVNYDMTKYLDENSKSTEAIHKMEEEFGSVGQAAIMIKDISVSEANEVVIKIEAVDGVSTVSFDGTDSSYYKDNMALFKIFLETGDFDVKTYDTIDDIEDVLDGYDLYLSGSSIDGKYLTESVDKDMAKILIIACIVIFGILMICSSSWVEPILFAVIAGGAILINMGTNVILSDISFITKAICAIMQLALAMDYAIILLHSYNTFKNKGLDTKEALSKALSASFAPISSSSLTTIAGLVALMFMSFSIGFDVGFVLAKGILVSLLCVFLFMPAFIVLLSKPLAKTKHRSLFKIIDDAYSNRKSNKTNEEKISGFAKFQKKTVYIIPFIALALIAVGCVFNSRVDYSYELEPSSDKTAKINTDAKEISDNFGIQNALVIILPKEDCLKEAEITEYLMNYTYNGKKMINSYQGLAGNGAYQQYTKAMISQTYGIPQDTVNSIFTSQGITGDTIGAEALITYLYTNSNAKALCDQLQVTELDNKYSALKTQGLFNSDNSLNTTVFMTMATAYQADPTTYQAYGPLLASLDAQMLRTAYAFVNEEVANLMISSLGNGDGKIYGCNALKFLSLNKALETYGTSLQNGVNEKYALLQYAKGMLTSEDSVRAIYNLNMDVSEESFKVINEITDKINEIDSNASVVSLSYVYSQIKDVYNDDMVKVNLISFFAILLIVAITFRAFLIPIVLSALVQGAIWISMGGSAMFGQGMFFVCYLVVMCIQMGATIDYAILLTNKYRVFRVNHDKYHAIKKAFKESLPTILTSGSILVLAAFIIGLVSNVGIISEIGFLLSRGCLISIILIVFALPQTLLLLDKVIAKTSYKYNFLYENKKVTEEEQEIEETINK